jgi:hypothetical protein
MVRNRLDNIDFSYRVSENRLAGSAIIVQKTTCLSKQGADRTMTAETVRGWFTCALATMTLCGSAALASLRDYTGMLSWRDSG